MIYRLIAPLVFVGWFLSTGFLSAREPDEVLELWGASPPNETGEFGQEADTTKESDRKIAGRRLMRIGNVTKPTLSVFSGSRGNG